MKQLAPLLGLLLLLALLFVGLRSQRVLERGLPPRIVHENQAAAWAAVTGKQFSAVLGTGSMAPYIPAAPAGIDPHSVVVAYAVERPGATYADITPGALVVYRPAWNQHGRVMHPAAQLTAAGWVMSGLHNRNSEAFEPLTPAGFVGLVESVHVW